MDIFTYYTEHSRTTFPGNLDYLFDDLPDDLPQLCEIVRRLVRHYADAEDEGDLIPRARFQEMDMRYVETMLIRILHYSPNPLNYYRQNNEKILGVCRDNSLLICSILRHKNIPARLRTGYVNYIIPELYLDGVFLEYWDQSKNKWCIVDTRTTQARLEKSGYHFDLYDVPSDRFVLAPEAWQLCRNNKVSENRFGFKQYRGLCQVRNRLIQDLAMLNKDEVLVWDVWGLMYSATDPWTVPPSQFPILDDLSQFLKENAYDLSKLREYYQSHDDFRVPSTVKVFNPFFEMKEVMLK